MFVVPYDWRLPVGPDDGDIDGVIGGLTAGVIADNTFEYGVDYLGEALKRVVEAWETNHPGVPLESVDVIAHSMGGLVTRTYIQSAAYNAVFDGVRKLPKIETFIMAGVPNRGASKPWNLLQDNFRADLVYRLVFAGILDRAYLKVLGGETVTGPNPISASSLPASPAAERRRRFIELYVPNGRTLLATYDFLYGTGEDTLARVVQREGPSGESNTLWSFHATPRDALPGEVWFEDREGPGTGDGTVPVESAIEQFASDSRVTLKRFSKDLNTGDEVDHLGLMANRDVQKFILETLGVSFQDEDISTGLSLSLWTQGKNGLLVANDPVEGFVVDGAGRRLGCSSAIGAVTEIPNSVWFGNTDGMGWVFGPFQEPLTLQLQGLGEPYYIRVDAEKGSRSGTAIDEGTLRLGAPKNVAVPVCCGPVEICGNCLDDDADGFIDLADDDCIPDALAMQSGALTFPPKAGRDQIALQSSFAGG